MLEAKTLEGLSNRQKCDERVIERWLVERTLGQLSFVMQQLAAAVVSGVNTPPPTFYLQPDRLVTNETGQEAASRSHVFLFVSTLTEF